MRKVMLIGMFIVFLATVGWAQEPQVPTKEQALKVGTLEELQWKQLYIQERLKTLQTEYANLQSILRDVQAELKARQPENPKADKKVESKKDKK